MDIDIRVENLEKRVNALFDIINRNQFYVDADIDGTRHSIYEINKREPYKSTKTAYIDDTSITFTGVPEGNMIIFCPVNYTVEKQSNTVVVTFEPLTEVIEITIMIQ